MSADYRTGHYKGYLHHDQFASSPAREARAWIHVVQVDVDGQEVGPVGDFSRGDISELVELAGQAWPGIAEDLADEAAARQNIKDPAVPPAGELAGYMITDVSAETFLLLVEHHNAHRGEPLTLTPAQVAELSGCGDEGCRG